jgi:hypothetical protein
MRNCHVRRLTIQAPDALAARCGAQQVEDGLRTAGLPGESSRLLIVRRLDLGVLPPAATPSAVAQRIERTLAELPSRAVAAAGAAAAAADAVWFADELEPCVLLAVHAAGGRPPAGWFWPRAVAGWQSSGTAAEAVRCALQAASQLPEGPAAVAQVVAALLAAGLLDRALEALRPEDGPPLLAQCGWQPAAGTGAGEHAGPRTGSPAGPPSGPHAPLRPHGAGSAAARAAAHAPQLARWSARWGAGDARTLWLAAALLAATQPALAGDGSLGVRAGAWLRRVHALPARPAAADGQGVEGTHTPPRTGRSVDAAPSGAHDNSAGSRPGGGAAQRSADYVSPSNPPGMTGPAPAAGTRPAATSPDQSQLHKSGHGTADEPAAPRPEADLWWRGLPLHETRAAGIWFLLPLLRQLGLAAHLAAHPELAAAGLGWCVLEEVAQRLAVPVGDPLWRELAPPRTPAGDCAKLMRAAGAWCDQVETWCAEQATLSLADIVLRTGWLYTTRTHVDLFFDLGAVDLRVRRLGLDLDPGWVPWLGRVVTFYYEAGMAAWATQLGN